MKKAIAALSVPLALATAATALVTVATPAVARTHHRDPAPYGHVDSGWGPPSNWNDIEVSHPEGGGA
jgi:hypothetical protein